MHEPIEGVGRGLIEDKKINYELGVSAVIPEGIKHKIIADNEDLYLLVKFVSALVLKNIRCQILNAILAVANC